MKRQFVTFRIGEMLFGIDVLLVYEINRQLDIVPVAGAPEYVCGLLNLRGQIVTVIDLGVRIGVGDQKIRSESRCVVLRNSRMMSRFLEKGVVDDETGPDMIGLLVSRVEDIITVEHSDIEPPPAHLGDAAGRFSLGVIQTEAELLNVLRVREIVAFESAERAAVS